MNTTHGVGKILSTVGSGSAIGLGVVCPACIPAVGAFLGSIGLPILASASVLKPVLALFLGLAAVGFVLGYRKHRNPWPLVGAVVGAAALYAGRWVVFDTAFIYLGAATLLTSSIANMILRRRATVACCSGACEVRNSLTSQPTENAT